jgi:hypothetical protein
VVEDALVGGRNGTLESPRGAGVRRTRPGLARRHERGRGRWVEEIRARNRPGLESRRIHADQTRPRRTRIPAPQQSACGCLRNDDGPRAGRRERALPRDGGALRSDAGTWSRSALGVGFDVGSAGQSPRSRLVEDNAAAAGARSPRNSSAASVAERTSAGNSWPTEARAGSAGRAEREEGPRASVRRAALALEHDGDR